MPGVVVEGPDGSGKTTLIKKIRNEFHWPVVHVVQPAAPDIPQMVKLVDCAPVVFDRFHLSEIAYGNVLRDGSKLDWHDLWALEGLLVARGFVLITCLTDVNAMLVNNRNEEQLFEAVRNKQPMIDLVSQYRMLSLTTTMVHTRYDFLNDDVNDTLNFVKENTNGGAPVGVIGSPHPEVWLVGDERSGDMPADYPLRDIPFYGPGEGDKVLGGTILGKAMNELGLLWGTTALSNSAKPHGVLYEWYQELGAPEKVVALGQVASKRLGEAGIKHRAVLHPQYVRRFHYNTAMETMLAELMKGLADDA